MISLGCTQRDARHYLPSSRSPHIQNPIHLCKIHFEVLQTQKPGGWCTPLKTTVNLQQSEISSQGISSLPPCRFRRPNSSLPAWPPAPLPTEPSHWPQGEF